MKTKIKTISNKLFRMPLALLAITIFFTSCSSDDDGGNKNLIDTYDLPGTYTIEIASSFMGSTPVASGTHQATFTDEGGGVLRLQFGGFNIPPMPFMMSVDASFTLSKSEQKLIVHNVDGQSFFDADVPPGQTIDPNNLPPGLQLPAGALQNGLHSNGNSTISGEYNIDTNTFNLTLDPAVGLPIMISIKTL